MKKIGFLGLLAWLSVLPAGPETFAQAGDLEKVAEAAAVAQYKLLFGEEVPILVERAFATLNEMLPKISALWGTGKQPGPLEPQWVAAATALKDDMVLYLRSSVDAAEDALKAKQGRGTEADLTQLRARVQKTLDYLDQVVSRKGAEVAIFRDVAQGWVTTLRGYKEHLPGILIALKAEPAFARDTATRVAKTLKDPEVTLGELEDELRALDIARRGLVAAKAQAMGRGTQIAGLLKTITPEVLLAGFRKASEGWIPADNGDGTFVSPSLREMLGKWPPDLESGMTEQYSEIYREAIEAVKPLLQGDFYKGMGPSFESVSLENLDKVLDPYIEETRRSIVRAREVAAGERDLDHAEKAMDGELAAVQKRSEREAEARKVGQLIREAESRASHEADRRAYQKIGERWKATEDRWQKAVARKEKLEGEVGDLKANRPRLGSPDYAKEALQHLSMLRRKETELKDCYRLMDEIRAEDEEIREQYLELKARVRGD
ncbi:MAG: hypothetical protein MUE73_07040 [Planctomycetes bacterium]|jgi:hypothetical protein|nr:hypothetical protein [Planctomycetota bacterium]